MRSTCSGSQQTVSVPLKTKPPRRGENGEPTASVMTRTTRMPWNRLWHQGLHEALLLNSILSTIQFVKPHECNWVPDVALSSASHWFPFRTELREADIRKFKSKQLMEPTASYRWPWMAPVPMPLGVVVTWNDLIIASWFWCREGSK